MAAVSAAAYASCAVEMPRMRIARVPAASRPAGVHLLQDLGAVIASNPSGRCTGSDGERLRNACE